MIKIENFKEFGFDTAVRGVRLSYKSGDKSDSFTDDFGTFHMGEKDHDLILSLSKKSDSEATPLRQMIISFDVTAPIMWWKQMDRYSVGKTQMSESTMHTLMNSPVTVDDFATDGIREKITVNAPDNTYQIIYDETLNNFTTSINYLINVYKELKNNVSSDPQKAEKLKEIERMVELLLPESYLQKRTITMNYTVFRHIYYDRYYKPHKMLEWRQFCEQMLDRLSYVEFIDEKLKLAEERNDLLSELTSKRMEALSLERKIDEINEKLNGEAEG